MKKLIRKLLLHLPINLNQNITYDRQAKAVLRKTTHQSSSCVDVGCHKGEILDLFLEYCPYGHHLGFEPIPHFYQNLQTKYGRRAQIKEICLSDKEGKVNFHLVKTNPAYSGILKRKYDRPNEEVEIIEVKTNTLDNSIEGFPHSIDFIKIDVEGAEYKVLKGAVATLQKHRPVVVFEFGLGAADVYGTSPEMMYNFFQKLNYKISLLELFLKNENSLSPDEFASEFQSGKNYYFVAWPE
nr:FkbM family methyltransferase [Saprospiraceae bacterium]